MKSIGHNPLLVKLIVDTPSVSPIAYAEQTITISSTTQVINGEFDYVHPTGSWGPFDTDDGII